MKLKDLVSISSSSYVKITKIGAGYVERQGTDYRCSDCWIFIPDKQRCGTFGANDVVKPSGYCVYWEFGKPLVGIRPMNSYTPAQAGYGEKVNGTKCQRCKHSDGKGNCEIVEGPIKPNGCCNNQSPK